MTTWLTIPEAADYLRCSERLLREILPERQVPHVTFAGKALFHPESLDRWLLGMEKCAMPREAKVDAAGTQDAQSTTEVLPGHSQDKVVAIISELLAYEDSFVQRLGRNLQRDLDESNQTSLSTKVYAQLSRWCHPRRDTKRERWTKQRVHELSQILFGKVIDRTQHPSYR